jgi:hypothetical protein
MQCEKTGIGITVGTRVRALKTLGEGPSGDSPGSHFCNKGDELVVREIKQHPSASWPLCVSHEHIIDRSFYIGLDEVEAIPNAKYTAKARYSTRTVIRIAIRTSHLSSVFTAILERYTP